MSKLIVDKCLSGEEKDKFILQTFDDKHSMFISSYIETIEQNCVHDIIKSSMQQKKRIIYLLPMKSLCNQLYSHYMNYYKELIMLKLLSIGIVTGERKHNINADVLIMTPECLLQMLYKKEIIPLDNILLFDKFHYINDKERGKNIEELLLFVLSTKLQFIFFSLPFSNLDCITEWLCQISNQNFVIIQNEEKEVVLNHYLYYDLHPQYYSQLPFENQLGIVERIQRCIPLTEEVISKVYYDIVEFKKNNGYVKKDYLMNNLLTKCLEQDLFPAVCLVLSRRNLERLVENIHISLTDTTKKDTVEEFCLRTLEKLHNSSDYIQLTEYKMLLKLFKRGIGIHHAGMLTIFKELVEILLKEEYIKIVFSTETFFTGSLHSVKTILLTENVKFDGTEERPLNSYEYLSYFQKISNKEGNIIHLPNFYSSFYLDSFQDILSIKDNDFSSKFYSTYSFVFRNRNSSLDRNEFESIKQILTTNSFLTLENELTSKGFIASEITEIFSLFIAEYFSEMCELSNKNIVCFLSCFINVNPNIYLNYKFSFVIEDELQIIIEKVLQTMSEYSTYTNSDNNYYFQYYLLEYVSLWYDTDDCNKVLNKIKKDKVLFVGDFVKAVLKIICIINEIKYISIAMETRCDEIINMLLKNIVNNQSLYIN